MIDNIENGEQGGSVRAKLNAAISKANQVDSKVDSSALSAFITSNEVDTKIEIATVATENKVNGGASEDANTLKKLEDSKLNRPIPGVILRERDAIVSPDSILAHAGKVLSVNATATALEYKEVASQAEVAAMKVEQDTNVAKLDSNNTFNENILVEKDLRVQGNFEIEGNFVTRNTTDLAISDNVIELNNGEAGAGVTSRYSGIQIDRGTETSKGLVFDEQDDEIKYGDFDTRNSDITAVTSDTITITDAIGVLTQAELVGKFIKIFKESEVAKGMYITGYNPTTRVVIVDGSLSGVDNTWKCRILINDDVTPLAVVNKTSLINDDVVTYDIDNKEFKKSGLQVTDGAVKIPARILDVDAIAKPGDSSYRFNMFGTNASNRPNIPYLNDGFLMTLNWDSGNYFAQLAIDVDGTAMGYRGSSTDWRQISTTNMKVCDNLLPGSKLDKQYSTNAVFPWVSYVTYEGYRCLKMTDMPYYTSGAFSMTGFEPLIVGEDYVLSFDAINPNNEDIRLDFTPSADAGGASRPYIEYDLPQSTTWVRHEWKFTVTTPGELAKYLNIFATGKTGTWNGYFKEFKLERGSTKTGFSQSFNDKADVNGSKDNEFAVKLLRYDNSNLFMAGNQDEHVRYYTKGNTGNHSFKHQNGSAADITALGYYTDNNKVRLHNAYDSGYVDVYNAAGDRVIRLDGSDGSLIAKKAKIDSCNVEYSNSVKALSYNGTTGNFNFSMPYAQGDFYFNLSNGTRADIYCKTLHQSSDERLKENITTYTPNASIIRAVQFDFKEECGASKRQSGYIAQEVEELGFGQYVEEDDKGMKSLDYTGIHTAKIACLEAKVAKLEELVNKLMETK